MKNVAGLLFGFFVLLIVTPLNAQKPPAKFGEIETALLTNNICPIDSGAHAYYVFDFGDCYFEIDQTPIVSNDLETHKSRFSLRYTHHFRIKINDNNGLDEANLSFKFYSEDDVIETRVEKIEGITFNLVDNKAEKTKLDKNSIVKSVRRNWVTMEFPMPNVRPGSVIEVSYTLISEGLGTLPTWFFQHTIPTLQSEFHTRIPEYFTYNKILNGYFPISTTTEQDGGRFTLTYTDNHTTMRSGPETYIKTYSYFKNNTHYLAKDVPALPDLEYIINPENNITKVDFELAGYRFDSPVVQTFNTSWEEINKFILDHYNLERELKNFASLENIGGKIVSQGYSGPDAMNEALEAIQHTFRWNTHHDWEPTNNLYTALNKGEGNSADINLCLIRLLRDIGFEAFPVLISTRANGNIKPYQPSIYQLNSLIALVKFEGKNYLMDATSQESEVNQLPLYSLNGVGWILDRQQNGWVDLLNGQASKEQHTYELILDENLNATGTATRIYTEYGASAKKSDFSKAANEEEYYTNYILDYKGLTITDKKNNFSDSSGSEATENLSVKIDGFAEQAGDVIYFSPAYFDNAENPFKLEERLYPVEFDYPIIKIETVKIKLPDGYLVESLPKPLMITLPDKAGRYVYNIVIMENWIMLTSTFSMNKTIMTNEEYSDLRMFYTMIQEKQREKIVLKKS